MIPSPKATLPSSDCLPLTPVRRPRLLGQRLWMAVQVILDRAPHDPGDRYFALVGEGLEAVVIVVA
ncbi:MAG: hypothetical protein BGN91_07805 [Nitrobacter sp. 62-13]|nr:MAG: hypothetical protein BGN91_07805 [Nitrobacter sp. 62-13]